MHHKYDAKAQLLSNKTSKKIIPRKISNGVWCEEIPLEEKVEKWNNLYKGRLSFMQNKDISAVRKETAREEGSGLSKLDKRDSNFRYCAS